jgi:transcriptional regulator with XRE-family HTH domain
MTVGERIQARRKRLFLTQTDVAAMTGLNTSTIAHIEIGRATPRPRTIRKLAEALGVDPAWLAYGEPEPDQVGPMGDEGRA